MVFPNQRACWIKTMSWNSDFEAGNAVIRGFFHPCVGSLRYTDSNEGVLEALQAVLLANFEIGCSRHGV